MLVAEGVLIRLQGYMGKAKRKKMKYLSEIEPLINTAITNQFNMFTKHEFSYTFNIFITITFTTV